MQQVTPYLYYEDLAGALTWLAEAFGFRECGEKMSDAGGTLKHAAMQVDDGFIMMGAPGSEFKNPKRLGHVTQCLYVRVNDVDRHCERARKAGAKIIDEMKETDYGDRRYGAADPEGHHWYFAQSVRDGASGARKASS